MTFSEAQATHKGADLLYVDFDDNTKIFNNKGAWARHLKKKKNNIEIEEGKEHPNDKAELCLQTGRIFWLPSEENEYDHWVHEGGWHDWRERQKSQRAVHSDYEDEKNDPPQMPNLKRNKCVIL